MATNNAWNTPDLTEDGQLLIGNGTNRPTATTLTQGANATITNNPGSIEIAAAAGGSSGWVLISSATANSSANIDFKDLSSTYFTYIVIIDNYQPVTDTARLRMRTSTDNGISFDSSSGDYSFNGWIVTNTGLASEADGANASELTILGSSSAPPGNATNETCSAFVNIYNPSAADYTRIVSFTEIIDSSGDPNIACFSAPRREAVAVDAIRFIASTGNISTGEFRLYGIVAS